MLPKRPTARQGKACSNWASPQAPQWTSWWDYRFQYYVNTWKSVINHIRVNKGTLAQDHLDHLQGQVNNDEETWNDPVEEDNHQFTAAQQVVHSAIANVSKTTSLSPYLIHPPGLDQCVKLRRVSILAPRPPQVQAPPPPPNLQALEPPSTSPKKRRCGSSSSSSSCERKWCRRSPSYSSRKTHRRKRLRQWAYHRHATHRTSTRHRSVKHCLPILKKVRKSIKRGEFVDLSRLLAEHMAMTGTLGNHSSKAETSGVLRAWRHGSKPGDCMLQYSQQQSHS